MAKFRGEGWFKTPWYVRKREREELKFSSSVFLAFLQSPSDGPWDLQHVVATLLSLSIEDAGIVLRGVPLTEIFEDLERFVARGLPRLTKLRAANYSRWKEATEPTLYRALSTRDPSDELRNLDRLAVWLACLACASDDWFRKDVEQSYRGHVIYRREIVAPIFRGRSVFAKALENPPTGDARVELAILATTITAVPDTEICLATANEILSRRPELSDVVNAVLAPLRLVKQYGYLVSDRLSPPSTDTASPERPSGAEPLQGFVLAQTPAQLEPTSEGEGATESQVVRRSPAPREHRPGSRSGIVRSAPTPIHDRITARVLRGSLVAPSPETLADLARDAETIEDRITPEEVVVTESSRSEASVPKSRAFAVRARCAMRQGVWARGQWDALTAPEMRYSKEQLWKKWQSCRDDSNSSLREAAALALLCACTGFSASRAHCLRTEDSENLDGNEDRVRPNDGLLSMSLPGTDPRFKPSEEQQAFLAPVGDRIEIHLPQELCEIVACLPPTPEGYLFAAPLEELLAHIGDWLATERDAEPRFTLARMHRAHQLEVLVQSGDIGLSQLVCGDPLGVATTPTSYYSARMSDIQANYAIAIGRHGFTPSLSPGSQGRAGSRMMLTKEAAASIAPSVCRRLIQSPRATRTTGRRAIELHGEIVPSLALMLMAATTFRPTFRLGKLTTTALCLPTSIAVISDKVSDERHFARLVPLCPMLKSSFAAYGEHLERLVVNRAITPAQRAAAKGALDGSSPLLFMFHGAGVRVMELEALDSRLPDGWILPRNFLRHRTATTLREAGCPGGYVQALLGHVEAGLQPFGEESFMDPQHYLQTTSEYVDEMLKADGWLPLMGGSSNFHVFERHRPPLKENITKVIQQINTSQKRRFQEQRKHVSELRKSSGTTITQLVEQTVLVAMPDLASSPANENVISSDQVSLLADLVCKEAEGIAEIELRIEALRKFLMRGKTEHAWKVKRLPRFHIFPPTPSVFHSDFVPGYAAINYLRHHFSKELADCKAIPDGDRCLLHLLLALIFWHGVADETRLVGIVSGIRQAQRLRGLNDAIVVPTFLPDPNLGPPKATSELLRGAVALAAVGARQYIPDAIEPSDLKAIVSAWVPRRIFAGAHTETLDALLAAAALTHRFESPPPLRAIWTGEVTSAAISSDRVISLFQGAVATTGKALTPEPLDSPAPSRSRDTGTKPLTYESLKAIIRYKKGQIKTFPCDVDLSSETNSKKFVQLKYVKAKVQTDAAIRKETIERLEKCLAAWPEDYSFMRAFTAYAHDRLRFGTPWKKFVQQSSVYVYLLGAATQILAQRPDASIRDMDAEDFHDLYRDCLDSVSASYSRKVEDYLAYFHSYLVAKGLAPSVAIGRSGRNGRCFPDVGYVTPSEISQAIELLKETKRTAQTSRGSTSDLEAATAALSLGFASGARTSETLLRQVRELVISDGRRALLVRRNPYVGAKTNRSVRHLGLEETMPASSWGDVLRWRDETNDLRWRADGDRTAFFLDAETLRPMDTSRLTCWITPTLRQVTGAADARPYWWRHTSASNEFLALMADDALLAGLREAVPSSARGWLPKRDVIVRAIGSNVPMGQAHAAEYRSRRGHSRMRTSLETYIHVAGLIQPPGSRTRAAELSSTALSVLAGLAPASGRKRLSRAKISSFEPNSAIPCLMDTWTDFHPDEVDGGDKGESSETVGPDMRRIATVAVAKAILRGIRTGEPGLVSSALHLTQTEAAKWQTTLFEATNTNVYGLSLPEFASGIPNDAASAPIATMRKTIVVQGTRVDESWILDCLAHAIKDPTLQPAWDIVLRGVDPMSGYIAVSSEEEFELVATKLPKAIDSLNPTSKFICNAVVTNIVGVDSLSVAKRWLDQKSILLPVSTARDFFPPAGWQGLGLLVTRRSNGRRVRNSVLLAALLGRALRALQRNKS